jgi:hypothetical protein
MKKQLLTIFAIACASAAVGQSIPNNGFESWSTPGAPGAAQEPTNYVTENILSSFILGSNPISVTQATGVDACAGTYSAKITTVHLTSNPSGGAIPNDVGIAILGTIVTSPSIALKSGQPWTSGRLYSMDVCYKYTPVNSDNGALASYLTRWNGASRDTLAVAYYPLTSVVSSMTTVSVPFVYDINFPGSMQPDSIHVYFLSSANPWIPGTPTAQVGSALWVDNATAVGLKGAIKLIGFDVKAYPNPASSFFTLSATTEQAVTVDVFDITGKKIADGVFDDKKVRIETIGLAEGLYLYSVKDKERKVIATGKVNVAK